MHRFQIYIFGDEPIAVHEITPGGAQSPTSLFRNIFQLKTFQCKFWKTSWVMPRNSTTSLSENNICRCKTYQEQPLSVSHRIWHQMVFLDWSEIPPKNLATFLQALSGISRMLLTVCCLFLKLISLLMKRNFSWWKEKIKSLRIAFVVPYYRFNSK